MARFLRLCLFATVLAMAVALESAPKPQTAHNTINLATAAAGATPASPVAAAKPFYDPMLMYNPYMCVPP